MDIFTKSKNIDTIPIEISLLTSWVKTLYKIKNNSTFKSISKGNTKYYF